MILIQNAKFQLPAIICCSSEDLQPNPFLKLSILCKKIQDLFSYNIDSEYWISSSYSVLLSLSLQKMEMLEGLVALGETGAYLYQTLTNFNVIIFWFKIFIRQKTIPNRQIIQNIFVIIIDIHCFSKKTKFKRKGLRLR